MKAFAYRAVDHKTQKIQKGQISAADTAELNHTLDQMGLELIEAKVKQSSYPFAFVKKINKATYHSELITLCHQMADMLNAGVSFEDAFKLCAKNTITPMLRDSLHQIIQDVRSGDYVCAAFARHPHLFGPVFIALLEAGELSGDLGKTFDKLNKQLQWQDQVSRQIKKATRYPLFLLCLVLGVITFMFSFVLPEMLTFLTDLNQTLPWTTRFLIVCGELFVQLWWMAPTLLFAAGMTAFLMRRFSQESAILLDHLILSIPFLGPVLKKLALARLTTSFSSLVQSGLPLPDALKIAIQTLDNLSMAKIAMRAYAQLLTGSPFSRAASILFPPFALQMLKVGEKSGTIQPTLDRISQALETDAKDSVDRFLGLLEPALTLFVGSIMAWIVLAILGPIYGSLAPLSQ